MRDSTTPPDRPARHRIAVTVTAIAVVLAANPAVNTTRGSSARNDIVPAANGTWDTPTVAPRTSTVAAPAVDTAAMLRQLADRLAAAPADPPKEGFDYIEAHVVKANAAAVAPTVMRTVSASAPAGLTGIGAGGPGWHIQLWNSGAGASRDVIVDDERGCPALEQTSTEPRPYDGPLASNPDAVRQQILHGPQAGTQPSLLAEIGELYSVRFVPLATRRGILRALADEPGIKVRLGVYDRAGRPGIAVTGVYAPPIPHRVQLTLTFDQHTGQLLARQIDSLPTTPGTPDPIGEEHGYLLILTSTYTRDMNTPTPMCGA
jgi:hypothetical protein